MPCHAKSHLKNVFLAMPRKTWWGCQRMICTFDLSDFMVPLVGHWPMDQWSIPLPKFTLYWNFQLSVILLKKSIGFLYQVWKLQNSQTCPSHKCQKIYLSNDFSTCPMEKLCFNYSSNVGATTIQTDEHFSFG